jgi:phospholipid N-methyltransferase
VVRSSPYLISRLLRSIDFDRARLVVQFGVGTGCITRELLSRMRPDARLLAIEINPVFVAEGGQIRDRRFMLRQACASSLPRLLRDVGARAGDIDYIVSSLPLAIMDDDLVDRILAVSQASLSPGGMFVQYQYSLKHLGALERRYGDVRLGFTLRNFPPAFVYECSQATVRDRSREDGYSFAPSPPWLRIPASIFRSRSTAS